MAATAQTEGAAALPGPAPSGPPAARPEATRAAPGPAHVPARVAAEIARREAAAERTIGWAQLAFVLVFAVLYAVTPRAEGAVGDSLVPLALAVYLAFTLFRLVLSYRIALPDWFLYLSIVADVALLCGLIFSFHLQYGQPAAFYLKAPTMIHLFIFIALRALRFDPRFVLIAGLAAVAGWMALMAYALLSDMGRMYVTRSYVDYLTSNAILIGAEIDKAVTLLAVTLILALAGWRARAVFMDAVASRTAAEDLGRFFAPEVARTITEAEARPEAARPEMRHATVLILDVRGFTRTAAGMPPEAVLAVLRRYQDIAVAAIAAEGGQIDKFLGDGILATFGAVAEAEAPAAAAIRAARAAVAALDAAAGEFAALGWPGAFRTGAGIASGPVTVGVVGAGGRFEFTVIGDAVNRAVKIEGANKTLGTRVLTDLETLALARAQGLADGAWPLRRGVAVPGLPAPADLACLA